MNIADHHNPGLTDVSVSEPLRRLSLDPQFRPAVGIHSGTVHRRGIVSKRPPRSTATLHGGSQELYR